MVPPRKGSYRNNLFDRSTLTSLDAVECAVLEFQAIINDANIERMLEDLMAHERPDVVRLVLSCLNEELIMSHFPTTPEAFGASLYHKLLSFLSVFFLFAQTVPGLHINHQGLVKQAPDLLSAIASKLTSDAVEPEPTAKKTSQKKIKSARRAAAQSKSTLDPIPFENLNMAVPETRKELYKSVEIVLATQRSILEAYLASLRISTVAASLKAACLITEGTFAAEAEGPLDAEEDDAGLDQNQNQAVVGSPVVSYAAVQPIKFSTLYRRRAVGFGEWEVSITSHAERNMRDYNRRDRKILALVVRKMRELSNGDFSPLNHKQINGGDVEIPIYEAKVTEDLRMVLIVPRYMTARVNNKASLKIFGVYEAAQLIRGTFWNSMSRELGKKGREYKDRCALRERVIGTNGDFFTPVSFPAQREAQFSPGSVPDLPHDDAEQIQSLLLKTVHFSQEMLDNILADRDVAFVLKISPRELQIIEHPHSCYVLGRSGTGKTTTMLYRMLLLEASSDSTLPKIRQLFVTQSRILADKVGEHFAKLLGGYRPVAVSENVKAGRKADRALIDRDDEDWRSDLPKKYSDLQDTDFPLFLSFDQLCTMVECDMLANNVVPVGKPTLTYEKFQRDYWPHFAQSLSKGLDCAMVFSELMGVIKGSEQTLTSRSQGYLDRDVYLNLSERSQSTFADQRARIYDLFDRYLIQKGLKSDTDTADRTHAILKFIQNHGVPGRRVDYLYVDEAQDNLLIDTLCNSFRFNELKAFLFRIEENRQRKHPELAFNSAVPPRMFQLTVNYRSHQGIVNCARSIIEVITQLWPDSIDSLDPEEGTVDGLRPIFFRNWDSENVESKQFLFGDPSEGSIELGAQQCILVRDHTAKEKLRKLVGDIGIILTLYESKGLEFNDVFLYNFFEDSSVPEAQWRVVLNAIENGPPAPALDSIRHASVCTELKFLYVAITRARNNIWIADCSTKGEPMRMLWTSRNQVQNSTLGTDTPRFAISSTPEEWQEQGQKLFDRKQFGEAKLCYERAYMPHEATVSEAYHLHREANRMPNSLRRDISARKAAFLRAAVAFMDCAKAKPVKVYFLRAGESFEHAGDVSQAIIAYSSAQHFGRVAELYRQLGKFDAAVSTIRNHSKSINPGIIEKIKSVARLFYFKKGQLEKATQLFEKQEEALEYLEDRGLHGERATVLESLGSFSAAAEVHLADGRTSDAIALFLQDHNVERASDCMLQGLWERLSFSVLPDGRDTIITSLLDFASQADLSVISHTKRDQIAMFRAIAGRDSHALRVLAQSFYRNNEPAAALLCLDHVFGVLPKIPTLSIEALVEFLQVFLAYVKLLYFVAFNLDPCNSSAASRLFGYRKADEDNYAIPRGTFIRLALPDRSEETLLLTGSELRTVFQQLLKDRLAKKVSEENFMCRVTKAFEGPCLTFALFDGRCNRDNCPQEHISASTFSPLEYNLRVRIHLQQILIYDGLHDIDVAQRSHWLSRLYAVLNPPSYQLGSAARLDFNRIPEANLGLQIVKEWVRGFVYRLGFIPDFLTRMVQLAHLGFELDRKHAKEYFAHSPFMKDSTKPLMYQRPPGEQYIVAEFLSGLENQEIWSLSAGVMFLRHIVMNRLNIHVNILCDVAENLCAGLVVADRQRRIGPIHDITLPLSWLLKRCSTGGGLASPRDTNAVWLFARALAELLEPIYSGNGADHLLFENRSLGYKPLGYTIRNIFVARICKCLSILAYNFRSYELRDFVWQSITSLRWDSSRQFALCSKYVNARSWAGLASAVRSSTEASALDEMVQLLHNSRYPPMAVHGVRQIVYAYLSDIPRLLGASPSIALTNSASNECRTDVDPTPHAETDEVGVDVARDVDVEGDERLPDDAPIDMPSIAEPEPPSQDELDKAAKIYKFIWLAHHRVEQRKKGSSKFLFAPALVALFLACKAQSLTMAPAHRIYRDYFLGPLPHLLLCLDMVHTQAKKAAAQMKKELLNAEHEALEIVDKKLTDVQRTLRQVVKIQEALQPTAEIHTKRNLEELKRWAEQAVTLLRALPFGTPPNLQGHIDMVYKGILKPPSTQTRRKEVKPKLNTEDEMC
ncbi:hypothetical protein C8F04DRAFT_1393598 [Mycena alexandri]|uniref:UvrD-like helicase C-terminal domain-containing protein n=1 Tax=Mycena alexandri TaxID=1745969 RepID=A0AAD6X9S8_9AGAR|nr:hypothetical protein C8F04DRAFT_1393598 [Mycena alexandri]